MTTKTDLAEKVVNRGPFENTWEVLNLVYGRENVI